MAVQFYLLPCPVSFPHDAEVLIVTYDFSRYNAFGQIRDNIRVNLLWKY